MHLSRVHSGKDSLRCLLNRWNDVRVRGAATEVAAHALANLVIVQRYMLRVQIFTDRARPALLGLAQHANSRANLSGSTVAALERIVFNESPLEGVQVPIIRQSLNRDDLRILMCNGEGEAAIYAPTIEQDGAGPALPVIATLLGTSNSQTLTQRIQQCCAGIANKAMLYSIHPE